MRDFLPKASRTGSQSFDRILNKNPQSYQTKCSRNRYKCKGHVDHDDIKIIIIQTITKIAYVNNTVYK